MAFLNSSSSIKAMTLALAGAVAVVPSEAEACSPGYCPYPDVWDSLEPLNAQAIPSDGVLLLQGARSSDSPEEDWLDKVELTVTRDGQPIAGAVEVSGVHDVLMWRPAAPLEPGDYKVVGSLDNPDFDPGYEYCGVDLALDFEFNVEAEPSAPLSPPKFDVSTELNVRASDAIEDLVCCDGAMPGTFFSEDYCSGGEEYVDWGEGFCAGRRGFGVLSVAVSVTTDLPPATSALVMRQLEVDGVPSRGELFDSLWHSGSKPFCVAVRLTNIVTGETVLGEASCHGEDVAAQLGDHAIDPAAELAQNCSQSAYTCELDEDKDAWDPAKCASWPEGEPTSGDPTEGPGSEGSAGSEGSEGSATGGADGLVDHGCACDSRAPSPFGALMLLGLGLLRPRRRRRPPR